MRKYAIPTLNKIILISSFLFFFAFPGMAQINLIPNTEDCSSTRAPFAFSITRKWVSSTNNDINCNTSPLSADIDNDGNVEVFVLGRNTQGPDSYCIHIFDGATGAEVGKIAPGVKIAGYIWTGNNFLICDVDKNGRGEVFIATAGGKGYLYEVNAGGRPLTFTEKWGGKTIPANNASPVVADLDGNGDVEFVVGNYVLDHNGNTIGTMAYKGLTTGWGNVEFPVVADLDNDKKAEIIVGTNVYKYNGTSLSLWRTCPTLTQQEGSNMVADVNQDGYVDVVFHSYANGTNTSTGYSYNGTITVWTPALNQTVGTVVTLNGQRSYPFVGDIDGVVINGKKYPEICVNTAGKLYAYTYNGSSFSQKWSMTHSDASGGTALTLFDFNLDGVVELVYRDQTYIQIFDGSGTTPNLLYRSFCGSETGAETPIIADVTGDGSADIIVTGHPSNANSSTGEVIVFEGGDSKWASAPSTWNQQ
ncbi:MAG: VCBS repeat-containing protein, partial [Tannerellaceae bacterium]|nr:VCBS repeat-containing protein [Tannerellaceae bacterium]